MKKERVKLKRESKSEERKRKKGERKSREIKGTTCNLLPVTYYF